MRDGRDKHARPLRLVAVGKWLRKRLGAVLAMDDKSEPGRLNPLSS